MSLPMGFLMEMGFVFPLIRADGTSVVLNGGSYTMYLSINDDRSYPEAYFLNNDAVSFAFCVTGGPPAAPGEPALGPSGGSWEDDGEDDESPISPSTGENTQYCPAELFPAELSGEYSGADCAFRAGSSLRKSSEGLIGHGSLVSCGRISTGSSADIYHPLVPQKEKAAGMIRVVE